MMLSTPPVTNSRFLRTTTLQDLLQHVADAQSASIVGVSNMGKSALLRDLCRPQVRNSLMPGLAESVHCFYIDCNRMLDQSEHAFYELILRVFLAELKEDDPGLLDSIRSAYETLLNPPSNFHVPLSFNQALTTLIETYGRRSVLVFDEFDAAFETLNPRTFLNLRALKDRHGPALTYVIATDRRLSHIRSGEFVDEFKELFAMRTHYIGPLSEEETRDFIAHRIQALNASFDDNDIRFLWAQAGGHPTLTEIACRHLAAVTGEVQRSDTEDWLIHREVRNILREDMSVTLECEKIWRDLTLEEQAFLSGLFRAETIHDPQTRNELLHKGLLRKQEGDLIPFCDLFRYFVQRRSAVKVGLSKGVRVDAETGEVTVDGKPVETLTRLEFRLLLLLYGHLNKICDKYSIVEAVWGEEYVDEVYDSSIEKLVSRLRRKIEPDPSNPRYLLTVRGRGYKLVG
ncbi:MAG: hypothetical protein D6775_03660 [Caldilineae bacterium]|nr:MAG: hypothetical protein D6775_03660 [Caldilineae bacterium]